MSGLRSYERDAAPLAAGEDAALAPPREDELLALVRQNLTRPGAMPPTAARWVYARWKPAISLTAGFELDYADGERRFVSWKRYAGGKALELLGRRERPIAPDVADERLLEHTVLAESGAHLWAPPFDRELPGLERASDLRRTKRWFIEQGLFSGLAVRSGSSHATLLRYKPERRAVLRLDLRLRPVEGGPKTAEVLGARALPPAQAQRIARARRVWQTTPASAVTPRLLACEERVGVIYEEWLDVETCARDAFDLAHDAGSLLARVHAERAPAIEPADAHGIGSAVELLSTQPQLRSRALSIAIAPRDALERTAWTHGDFHPDQLARSRSDGALRLLDLDRLGPGNALDDLASWVADHLSEHPEAGLREAASDLLSGYAAAGGRLPAMEDLALGASEGLVQRAAGALRRLEAGAVAKASRLLDQARDLAPKGILFA